MCHKEHRVKEGVRDLEPQTNAVYDTGAADKKRPNSDIDQGMQAKAQSTNTTHNTLCCMCMCMSVYMCMSVCMCVYMHVLYVMNSCNLSVL